MNVILTSICCGKTFLSKINSQYVDLDIFAGVKTKQQQQIVFEMVKSFAQKVDNTKVYLFNIDRFEKLELYKISEIRIIKIILARDYNFRCRLFGKRDIKEYGTVRIKKYKDFREHFSEIIKLGREYSKKYNICLQFLEGGKFLKEALEA